MDADFFRALFGAAFFLDAPAVFFDTFFVAFLVAFFLGALAFFAAVFRAAPFLDVDFRGAGFPVDRDDLDDLAVFGFDDLAVFTALALAALVVDLADLERVDLVDLELLEDLTASTGRRTSRDGAGAGRLAGLGRPRFVAFFQSPCTSSTS